MVSCLEMNLPLYASPKQASAHPWACWGANSRSPVRRDKVFPRHGEEDLIFWDVQCLAIGPLAARCFKSLLSCFLFLSHLSKTA